MRGKKSNKAPHILALGKLLDVPGTHTPWEQIAVELTKLPLRVLNGLRYRVEAARTEAYDDGVLHARGPRP